MVSPPNLLGDLPKLQCVARFADGRKMLLKIPVVVRGGRNVIIDDERNDNGPKDTLRTSFAC